MPETAENSIPLVITLFGPMQVLIGGEPIGRLRSRKALWLLALLALRGGRPVEREWLAGTLWPDANQDQALANLRTALSELRGALKGAGKRVQSPNRHLLRLDTEGVDADVIAFDTAIAESGLPALKRAVQLYQGPLLEGCTEEWVGQERGRREEECLKALVTLAEAALKTGDLEASAEYGRRAVGLDPWRDAGRRVLMEALAQSGDTNAALQVYRDFVALLRDDPKAVPDEKTSALYARLRTQARRQMLDGASENAAEKAAVPVVTGYLPQPLTDLVGREDESAEVTARLRRSRLVTLTGPGGIGKTRLALAVAAEAVAEYAGGVWLVPLDALSEGGQVPAQIAGVLGVKEETGRTLLESVAAALKAKRLLLVLDNCEHLTAACAEVAAFLLRECAGLRVLATSRSALGITGESTWAVPGLAVPDPQHLPAGRSTLVRVLAGYEGVRLFVERAQAVQKTFSLTGDNAPAAAEICARLGGMPLAIELAAARLRVLTVEQIAQRLDNHLGLLTGGSRVAPSRQQTLRATLDWSYSLLNDSERTLLARLSVFAGGWDLEGAEAVCAGGEIERGQILDLLSSLVDKSLVLFGEWDARGRYRLLETVRQYAAERLTASGEAEPIRARHRAWLEDLATQADANWAGPEQKHWRQRLAAEHDNFRATLGWGGATAADANADLRLLGLLWRFWDVSGLYAEGGAHLKRVLEQPEAAGATSARARALNGAGCLSLRQGDCETARRYHQESLNIRRREGNTQSIATSLHNLASVAQQQGDYPTAATLLEESLSLYREVGEPIGVAFALENLGHTNCMRGDYVTARALYEESLSLRRDLANTDGIAQALCNLGAVASFLGEWEAAEGFYEESLSLSRQMENRFGSALNLANLGNILQSQGRYEEAEPHLSEAHELFQTMGNRWGLGLVQTSLGDAAAQRGDHGAAQDLYRNSLNSRWEMGDREGVARSLAHLAGVALATAAPEKAVPLWGMSAALRESIGAPMPPVEQEEYDRRLAQARATLGDDRFDAAWERGRAVTWERILAEAAR